MYFRTRVLPIAVVVAAALAGCGDERGAATAAPSQTAAATATPAAAPVLLTFQRQGGTVATLDVLTVRADGSAELDKRYGGAGRRRHGFELTAATRAQVRRGLARLPRQAPDGSAPARSGLPTMLLQYRGTAYAAAEGHVPGRLRPLYRTLTGVIEGDGRGRDTAGGDPPPTHQP